MDGWADRQTDRWTDGHSSHSSVEFSQLPRFEGHCCSGPLECIQEVVPPPLPSGVTGDPTKKTMTTCKLTEDALNLAQHIRVYTCLPRLISLPPIQPPRHPTQVARVQKNESFNVASARPRQEALVKLLIKKHHCCLFDIPHKGQSLQQAAAIWSPSWRTPAGSHCILSSPCPCPPIR